MDATNIITHPVDEEFEVDLGPHFELENGGALKHAKLRAHTFGPHEAPVVAALGGISASRFVCHRGDVKGWWSEFAGPAEAMDSDKYRILGIDYLGGEYEDPESAPGRDLKLYPLSISTTDQARALDAAREAVGADRLHAIVSASYGAMVGLAYAIRFPERLNYLVAICGAHKADPMAIAWRSLQRRITREGIRNGRDKEGVALARALAMTTYRSAEEFSHRFDDAPVNTPEGFRFPLEGYLENRGEVFAKSITPQRFLALCESLDIHRVDPAKAHAPALIVAFPEDRLVPPRDMRELAELYGGPAEYVERSSLYAHDAFLKEREFLTPLLQRFLEEGPRSS